MHATADDLISRNSVFAWIALVTGAILLIPAIAMQFTDAVRWDATDFLVMAVLLSGFGCLFVLAARKLPRRHRAAVGVLLAIALIYAWMELAVGIFTDLGS